MKYPANLEIRYLIENNPAVAMVYTQACSDGWSHEKFLEQAFLVQARLNNILTRQITRLMLVSPVPINSPDWPEGDP